MTWQLALGIAAVGGGVGVLSGLFGKGGSGVATPLLAALGVPPIVAVASPLPATVPGMIAASWAYWRERLVDWSTVWTALGVGIPATAAGAFATRWIDGSALVVVTEVLVAALGVRFLLKPGGPHEVARPVPARRARLIAVSATVGVVSGLLANAGGFLLAPLFVAVLRLPIKQAFASSLAVATVLALPGTIVHAALGHIDWAVVAAFGLTSVPGSYVGARLALRTEAVHLERVYGAALAVLGIALLVINH